MARKQAVTTAEDDREDWFLVRVQHFGRDEDVSKMRNLLEKELKLQVLDSIKVYDIRNLSLKFFDKGSGLRWSRKAKK